MQNVFNHRHYPGQLFVDADAPLRHFGAGPRGFSSYINDVRAFVEHLHGMSDGMVSRKKLAAIGKRIRRDVQDSHDQGARAELELPAAQAPHMRRPYHLAIV